MLCDILSVYSKDNSYLILNSKVPSWIVTNLIGVVTIKEYVECLSFEKTAEKINSINSAIKKEAVLNFLENAEKNYLFQEIEASKHVHKPYFLHSLYFNMTQDCNLKCIYCFATAREEKGNIRLSIEKYKEILNSVRNLSSDVVNITFTGGEPLLSANTIPVAKYAKKLGFSANILTNATLINETNVKELTSIFDLFKISIDGSTEEIHDHYRGKGSYQKTVRAIELLKANNANIQIAMTVTRENVDDIFAMNKEWQEMLTYQPLFPLGRAKSNANTTALTGDEYYEALCVNENINPYSDIRNVINAHKANNSIMKCSMGDGELSISCTGDVYPCQLLHTDSFYLGNINENSLEEIYYSEKNKYFKFHTVDCIDKCIGCDFKYLCGGACQARHFSETGSIDHAGDFCEYEKKGIVNGIISSYKMIEL